MKIWLVVKIIQIQINVRWKLASLITKRIFDKLIFTQIKSSSKDVINKLWKYGTHTQTNSQRKNEYAKNRQNDLIITCTA